MLNAIIILIVGFCFIIFVFPGRAEKWVCVSCFLSIVNFSVAEDGQLKQKPELWKSFNIHQISGLAVKWGSGISGESQM